METKSGHFTTPHSAMTKTPIKIRKLSRNIVACNEDTQLLAKQGCERLCPFLQSIEGQQHICAKNNKASRALYTDQICLDRSVYSVFTSTKKQRSQPLRRS